jgi:hypothetical protein
MNTPDRAGVAKVKRGQLDYFDSGRVAVNRRVGCRFNQPGIPGLDLAALCLRPTVG